MQNLIGKFLWHDPIIFYAWMYSEKEGTVFDLLQERLAESTAYFLMWIPWSKESHEQGHNAPFRSIIDWVDARKSRYPRHHYIYMCNSPIEAYQLKENGISSYLLNQNVLIDPRVYRPLGNEKQYDAVYNAQFVPFKRHQLLAESTNILLLSHSADPAYYFQTVRNLVIMAVLI